MPKRGDWEGRDDGNGREMTLRARSAGVAETASGDVAKVKQDGIIEKIVAVVSPKAVNRTLSVLVEVEIQNEHRHTLEQFQRWLDRAPEVQSCWYVTGDMDYVLLVAVRDLEEYDAFIERLMSEQQALVRKYKSLIALKTVKHGLGLLVRE